MGYGNGKSYLDDWDEWEKHQKKGKVRDFDPAVDVPGYTSKPKSMKASDFYGSTTDYARCYESHSPLKLPGTELVIFGGSCSSPKVTDADVYIGFDGSMKETSRRWPWTPGSEVLFKIQDMGTPTNVKDFKSLVNWTREQLHSGLKVHCGCIGGHGRTGTFLAALCSEYGEKDAITYVRKNYCKKAVESGEQVKFLAEHFGVKKVDGYKSGLSKGSSGPKSLSTGKSGSVERFTHVPGNGEIWVAPAA